MFFEQAKDLARLRVSTNFLLGVQEFPVNSELECPFGAHEERIVFNDMLIIGQNVVRHTDGALGIVSRHTIF